MRKWLEVIMEAIAVRGLMLSMVWMGKIIWTISKILGPKLQSKTLSFTINSSTSKIKLSKQICWSVKKMNRLNKRSYQVIQWKRLTHLTSGQAEPGVREWSLPLAQRRTRRPWKRPRRSRMIWWEFNQS